MHNFVQPSGKRATVGASQMGPGLRPSETPVLSHWIIS